jgi:hypothetical protein
MEIFSHVLEGTLQHQDSMVNGRVLKPGDGLSAEDDGTCAITATNAAEALLFDLGPSSLAESVSPTPPRPQACR